MDQNCPFTKVTRHNIANFRELISNWVWLGDRRGDAIYLIILSAVFISDKRPSGPNLSYFFVKSRKYYFDRIYNLITASRLRLIGYQGNLIGYQGNLIGYQGNLTQLTDVSINFVVTSH